MPLHWPRGSAEGRLAKARDGTTNPRSRKLDRLGSPASSRSCSRRTGESSRRSSAARPAIAGGGGVPRDVPRAALLALRRRDQRAPRGPRGRRAAADLRHRPEARAGGHRGRARRRLSRARRGGGPARRGARGGAAGASEGISSSASRRAPSPRSSAARSRPRRRAERGRCSSRRAAPGHRRHRRDPRAPRRRPGGPRRLDAAEGRHGDQARPEPDHDGRARLVGQGLRSVDGRSARGLGEAEGPRRRIVAAAPGRRRGGAGASRARRRRREGRDRHGPSGKSAARPRGAREAGGDLRGRSVHGGGGKEPGREEHRLDLPRDAQLAGAASSGPASTGCQLRRVLSDRPATSSGAIASSTSSTGGPLRGDRPHRPRVRTAERQCLSAGPKESWRREKGTGELGPRDAERPRRSSPQRSREATAPRRARSRQRTRRERPREAPPCPRPEVVAAYAASAGSRPGPSHSPSSAPASRLDAEKRQRNPCREERIDEGRGRRQERPARARTPRRCETGERARGRRGGPRGRPRTVPDRGKRARRRSQAAAPSDETSSRARVGGAATPALVTPLSKRRTQIHPPSKTWCSAASSSGYGGARAGRTKSPDLLHPSHALEMRVEAFVRRAARERRLGKIERAVEEAPRPRGVDEKSRRQRADWPCRLPSTATPSAQVSNRSRRRSVEVLDALRPGFSQRESDRSPRGTSACRRLRRADSRRREAGRAAPDRPERALPRGVRRR